MMEQSAEDNGVRIVDRRGRRWYTQAYRDEVIEQCRGPGVSVAAVALQRGLNANLVRKWIAQHDGPRSMSLVPVKVRPEREQAASVDDGGCVIVIRHADIELVLGNSVSAQQIEAVIRALR